MRVLVVEDEEFIANMTAAGLRRAGIAVDVVHDGASAMRKVAWFDYDVFVLDRDLPGIHGDDICREVVSRGLPSRILMLTASDSIAERVAGLSIGVDDYLPKPFSFDELLARVLALGRRTGRAFPPTMTLAGITVDSARRNAFRDGRQLVLAPKEFAVLEALVLAEGAVVSMEDLLDKVWDESVTPQTNAVRVAISKIRAKLGDPPVLETVPGSGYRMAGAPGSAQP
ncbi:response regulator transcription factor [Streptomyces sp. NPDC001404]|uniref:response regulator transcription factor n=1 Tax=Streptomyces sp. NPDC001404 TaxID=3364571 RepID=UPI0036B92325